MAAYADAYWDAQDGVRLHYRDYAGGADGRPPILCLPGLTRNARDFAATADRLAGGWRLLCLDLRGRGESGYARDPMTYAPLRYVHDIEALLDALGIARFVAFGTSLGGLLTMLLAGTRREALAGALLNDIGPAIERSGLARIGGYVGKAANWPTWLHAARALAEAHGAAHPDFAIEDWLTMAKRVAKLTPAGRIVYDYDMRIAEPMRAAGGGAGVDLWPAFAMLAGRPVTLLRGALSDLLSVATTGAMAARVPGLDVVTVPRTGHAPTLDEPDSIAAIDRLLARVLAGG